MDRPGQIPWAKDRIRKKIWVTKQSKNLTLFAGSSAGLSVLLEKKSYMLCGRLQTQGAPCMNGMQSMSANRSLQLQELRNGLLLQPCHPVSEEWPLNLP